MRILYITFAFQHLKIGGSTRSYYFLKELARRHSVTLLTVARSEIPADAYRDVAAYAEKVIIFQASQMKTPAIAGINRRLKRVWQDAVLHQEMRDSLAQLVRSGDYDLVLFHGKAIFPVIKDFNALPLVVDFCDAASRRIQFEMKQTELKMRPLMAWQYLQMLSTEAKLVKKSAYQAFISSRDREAVMGQNSTAAVIPNGIDLDYWKRRSGKPLSKQIIFTGVMNYRPNVDAAMFLIRDILPKLTRAVPDIELVIAGRNPAPKLIKLAEAYPQVTVTGYVEDMRDYLEKAAVFVAPIRFASGMQNKVQEALAMQVPVVTTPVVMEGLVTESASPPPMYIASTAQEFTDCILNLLNNPDDRERLAREGRAFVEENFDWSRSAQRLEGLCQDALSTQSIVNVVTA